MSIDGRGSSPSRDAQNRISALVSERDRLKGQVKERTESRDELAGQIERIGAGLWRHLATTLAAAQSNPGELTLISRVQTAASMYETWAAVVDGDNRG